MKSALLQQIESTRVARFSKLKHFGLAFVDSLLPEGRKKNLKVIGKGVVERDDMAPPINEDHGFTVSYVLVPPGGGASLHAHKTAEVFVPINGELHVLVGEDKEELVMQPLDVVSIPVGVMRGFRNHTDKEIVLLAIVGGHTGGGSVTWHPEVLERAAKETGLALDGDGQLKRLPNFKEPQDLQGSSVF